MEEKLAKSPEETNYSLTGVSKSLKINHLRKRIKIYKRTKFNTLKCSRWPHSILHRCLYHTQLKILTFIPHNHKKDQELLVLQHTHRQLWLSVELANLLEILLKWSQATGTLIIPNNNTCLWWCIRVQPQISHRNLIEVVSKVLLLLSTWCREVLKPSKKKTRIIMVQRCQTSLPLISSHRSIWSKTLHCTKCHLNCHHSIIRQLFNSNNRFLSIRILCSGKTLM